MLQLLHCYVIEYKLVMMDRSRRPLDLVVLYSGGVWPPDREANLSYLNRLEGLTCRFTVNSANSCRCSFLDLVLSHHIELLV
jgi:hypothetical protein